MDVTVQLPINLLSRYALDAFNSKNRLQYPLNGQLVSNLEAVVFYLQEALTLSSSSFEHHFTLANMLTFSGDIHSALKSYQQVLLTTQNHQDKVTALTYLSVWLHHQNAHKKMTSYLSQLETLDSHHALQVRTLLATLEVILNYPMDCLSRCSTSKKTMNKTAPSNYAIIALGYLLNDDGAIAPPLLKRLTLTLSLANKYPKALIIVTGGLAKAGQTESSAMKTWLVEQGVNKDRVIEENKATNTIDNARLSLALLNKYNIQAATLVSASIHVHRSHILFDVLHWQNNLQNNKITQSITFSHVAVNDKLSTSDFPEGKVKRDCYIDALRSFGLPAFNCPPFVQI
ncbi:hypothetical protein C9J48_10395 [Photobacterium profundum]|uniref:DUF218 domain-containing protein n=1 Tax=Photobacterium profundum 3TCK TaxID=314280 RepID=Q1YX28_9GAMM|nr:YdcF family protein [Photobacterium profundum]EAS40854.1 hypothetical protein P3TCK_09293 [Photobacterium profundum 3TCK]PSV62370.1 hypothetical protein C9J48_10395 [Photobacterium profundum]